MTNKDGTNLGTTTEQQNEVPFFIRQRYISLILLTWAAGSIDVISFIGIQGIFTANMSGNIVLLGLNLGRKNYISALYSAVALVGYCLGVIIGELIVNRDQQQGGTWSKVVTNAIMLEALLLLAFTICWYLGLEKSNQAIYFLITLAALSMGIQSAAIVHLKIKGVTTTYFSGTFTSLTIDVLHKILLRTPATPSQKEEAAPKVENKVPGHRIALQAVLTFTYALAAAISGLAISLTGTFWPYLVIAFPLITVLGVLLVIFFRRLLL